MTPAPTISIIVPSYNQGRFLRECLESILAQRYPSLELIVMDGGSSDNSVEIIRQYESQLAYWQSQPDGGQSAGINAGVNRARGDLVAWLNSDDLYHEGALWSVARAWSKHPGRGLYIGNGFRLNDETKELARHNRRHMAFDRRALREGLDYVLQPSAFFNLADWRAVGGLDERLQFCMDWDILIRLAERNTVVLIDDFLGVSREYEDTKTASGGFRRVDELLRMVKSHTGQEMTIGGSIYAIWTLLADHMSGNAGDAFRHHIYQALLDSMGRLASLGVLKDGSPDHSEAGDTCYLPFVDAEAPRQPTPAGMTLPKITVVTCSFNQAEFLERALRSVIEQKYPMLEIIVVDGGSIDGSVEIIKRFESHLSHWDCVPGRGSAAAINHGFARATGEVLLWLDADDMLAEGALQTVGTAFAADVKLDLVYGDALLIDANDRPVIVDHGEGKTSLLVGTMQNRDHIPAYWSYRHSMPQPAISFRRRLMDRLGSLADHYTFIYNVEFIFRVSSQTKICKIDRILAFQRYSGDQECRHSSELIESYDFSRAWWPNRKIDAFKSTRDDFLSHFMQRYCKLASKALAYRLHRAFISFVVTHQLANPERMLAHREDRHAGGRVWPQLGRT